MTKKDWEVGILQRTPRGMQHKKLKITLGPKSDKGDVIQQLKRQGIKGEVLVIRPWDS